MNSIYKFLQRLSRFLLKLISIDYKKIHKFQNKNQVTNTDLILSLLQEKISPNYIVDIGCGHGEWFLKCFKFFPDTKYLLFDADNKNKEKLSLLSIKYQNISYKICLLSNKIQELKFFNMGYGSSVYEEKTSHPRKIEYIKSTTLKDELSKLSINTNNNIIKLDVQGSEIDILNGLQDDISLFEVIILETSLKEYNKNSPLFLEVINYMDTKAFSLYDICDMKRLGGKSSFLVQFDAVFVRKNSNILNLNFI
tara:strand:+ start:1317 stop:2072 length:756 start_codon:yes stop_codon:yes gene_type:complete